MNTLLKIPSIVLLKINQYWHASIQRQLVLGIALVHAVLMTIFILDLTTRERDFLQQQNTQQAIALAETLAANSSSWVLANDVIGLNEILSYQQRYPDLVYAMVLSPQGQVLGHTNEDIIGQYVADKISQAIFTPKQSAETQIIWKSELLVDIAAPIISGGVQLGWARVGISTDDVQENLAIVTRNGVLYTLLAIAIGIIFAMVMARGLTKGMHHLLKVTEEVRQGRRDITADDQRYDEIGDLGTAFNSMIVAIEQSDLHLKEAKRIAEESSQIKSQFIANMSHELRTPLNAIIGYSEILQDEVGEMSIEEIRTDLITINTAGEHLLSLIDDVLDLSKIESGNMYIYCEEFTLQTMLRQVIASIDILAKKENNQLSISYAKDTISPMHSDIIKVRQIILNLLNNACKFTKNGKVSLIITTYDKQGEAWVKLDIQDTGIGISPEQQRKLFRAFTQCDASTTREYGGTGLGLVLTKRFTEMLGGSVSVSSVLGEGSCFTVDLPMYIESSVINENDQKNETKG